MKKFSKLLLLALALVLLCGTLFGVMSLAAEEETYETQRDAYLASIGATTTHNDLSQESFDLHNYTSKGVNASPQLSVGEQSTSLSNADSKYGHFRTIKTAGGNTFIDLTFYDSAGAAKNTASDIIMGTTDPVNIQGYQYIVYEFDFTTRTSYPGDITVIGETRFEPQKPVNGTANHRTRVTYGSYSASTGLWTFGDTKVKLNPGEWAHITYVLDLNYIVGSTTTYTKTEVVTAEDGTVTTNNTYTAWVTEREDGSTYTRISIYDNLNGNVASTKDYEGDTVSTDTTYKKSVETVATYNYTNSVAKVYLNGQFVSQSTKVFGNYEHLSTVAVRQHYFGLGWNYSVAHTGQKALDSVAMDNISRTLFVSENEKLASLFSENPVTDITTLGYEVAYHAAYEFPTDDFGLVTLSYGTTTKHYGTFEEAMAVVKEGKISGATIQLLGNIYESVELTAPVTIDYNGFALQNSYTLGRGVTASDIVTEEQVTGLAVVSDGTATEATFNVYNVAYGIADATPVSTQVVELDGIYETVSLGAYMADATTLHEHTGAFEVRDSEGNVVELTVVAEENLGITYSVYPVVSATTSSIENPAFYSIDATGNYTFYETSDLIAHLTTSIASGTKVVLLANANLTAPLYSEAGELYVDLNGYDICGNCCVVKDASEAAAWSGYIYSSRPGSEIVTSAALLGTTGKVNSRNIYFGYTTASTKSDIRIAIYCPSFVDLNNGNQYYVYFNNCDVYNTAVASKGLFCFQWAGSRVREITFDNCNLYTKSPIHNTRGGTAGSTITFNNSNIYGLGDTPMCSMLQESTGTQTTNLNNTNVYGMTSGISTTAKGQKHNVNVNGECNISFMPEKGTVSSSLISGYETIHFDGVMVPDASDINADRTLAFAGDYTARYVSYDGVSRYATVNVYFADKSFANEVTPVVQELLYGDTFYELPAPEKLYPVDITSYFCPNGEWEIYDAAGNLVTFESVTSNQLSKTYSAYLVCEKKETVIDVKDANGQTINRYDIDCINDALGTAQIPEGVTLTLVKDAYISKAIYGNNSYIDLNGKTIYTKQKVDMFCVSADKNLFIYSSAEGARICVTPTELPEGSGYVCKTLSANSNIYIGYLNADTKCENRIEVFSGAFCELKGTNSGLYLNNLTMVRNGRDNYGYLNIRGGGDDGRAYYLENCDIYNNSFILSVRGYGIDNAATASADFVNCNIYNTNGASTALIEFYCETVTDEETKEVTVVSSPKDVVCPITLDNTKLYGGRTIQSGPTYGNATAVVTLKNGSTISRINENTKTEAGYILLPAEANSLAHPGVSCPLGGTYGAEESIAFNNNYSYAYEVVSESKYQTMVYQNVSLDTDINLNTYLPVWDYIVSAQLTTSEDDILNTENIITIGENSYYMITVGEAPKDASDVNTMVVTFKNGSTVSFEVSISRYAKRLLEIESEDAYTVDSQEMMKYVLNYIKEVAVEFNELDRDTVFADITGIDVNPTAETIAFAEPTDLSTDAISAYVTGATLDLNTYAGFAFSIEKDFVGTVRAALGNVSAGELTFTEDAPAAGDEVLVLSNIPAHAFRDTVTVTVTTASGEVVEASFNLATYVNYYVDKAYARAVYAYSTEAGEYVSKYPVPGTIQY